MASLLAGKPECEWSMVYNSIGLDTGGLCITRIQHVDSCEEERIRSLWLRSKGSCAPFVLDLFSLYIYLIDAAVALASTSTNWGRHRRVQAAALVCRQDPSEMSLCQSAIF
ncbi:unnamed protein product [Miscanthus lutarioriparius]|uniref:Uncharacterized protein n=1 Tax=Miscanthus lutarioriparius TaxID=422564 RepID=A0A811Q1H4_9POAL|nr:unnamed protein product [Miscanthus lutarioriparius]